MDIKVEIIKLNSKIRIEINQNGKSFKRLNNLRIRIEDNQLLITD